MRLQFLFYLFLFLFPICPNGILSDLRQCACNQWLRNVNNINTIMRCDRYWMFIVYLFILSNLLSFPYSSLTFEFSQ